MLDTAVVNWREDFIYHRYSAFILQVFINLIWSWPKHDGSLVTSISEREPCKIDSESSLWTTNHPLLVFKFHIHWIYCSFFRYQIFSMHAPVDSAPMFLDSVSLFLVCEFNSPFTGCMRLVKEQLNWGTKSELKAEVLHGIKEIGSILYWMGLLDIVLVSVLNSSSKWLCLGISNWSKCSSIWVKSVAPEFANFENINNALNFF